MLIYKIDPKYHTDICLKYENGNSSSLIAQEYNVSPVTICRILKKYNIKIREQKSFDVIQEQEIIKLYQDGHKISDLAKTFNVSHTTIFKCLTKNNIPKRTNGDEHRIYPINEDYFKVIDNELKAYFVGLLLADGCNYDNRIKISLKTNDSYILDNLLQQIYIDKMPELKTKIINGASYTDITICSQKLVQQLEKYNFVPRKSLILEFPNIPQEYLNHFIRGYLDGDGSINFKSNTQRIYIGWIGSFNFLNDLKLTLISQDLIHGNEPSLIKKGNVYDLKIHDQSDVYSVGNYLYNNATIYLKRKKDTFDKWMNTYNLEKSKNIVNLLKNLKIINPMGDLLTNYQSFQETQLMKAISSISSHNKLSSSINITGADILNLSSKFGFGMNIPKINLDIPQLIENDINKILRKKKGQKIR